MASWYDDLLKRQEYEAIQGRPTFKPNAFQEMFTPKGMEYQWQDRVADSGEVSTGDIEDLRMVRPGLSVATPTVSDGAQATPGGKGGPQSDDLPGMLTLGSLAKPILEATRRMRPGRGAHARSSGLGSYRMPTSGFGGNLQGLGSPEGAARAGARTFPRQALPGVSEPFAPARMQPSLLQGSGRLPSPETARAGTPLRLQHMPQAMPEPTAGGGRGLVPRAPIGLEHSNAGQRPSMGGRPGILPPPTSPYTDPAIDAGRRGRAPMLSAPSGAGSTSGNSWGQKAKNILTSDWLDSSSKFLRGAGRALPVIGWGATAADMGDAFLGLGSEGRGIINEAHGPEEQMRRDMAAGQATQARPFNEWFYDPRTYYDLVSNPGNMVGPSGIANYWKDWWNN